MKNKYLINVICCVLVILQYQEIKSNIDSDSKVYLNYEHTLNKKIDSIYNGLSMTGLAVVIVKDTSIIYKYIKGYRKIPNNNNNGVQLQLGDKFRIASISKTFVATIIMQLLEQGKIDLDDDAQNYLKFSLRNPSWKNSKITIRMLLTHTSSITDNNKYYSINLINPQINNNYMNCYGNYEPGTKYTYCNLNYNILGSIIENICSKRFDDVVEDFILNPLNIQGNYNCNRLDSNEFVKLYHYNYDIKQYVESIEAYKLYTKQLTENYELSKYVGLLSPCGGMKISPTDLAKFMIMHMNGGKSRDINIISNYSEEIMRQNYVGKSNYGFSFRQYKNLSPTNILYGQTGGAYGMRSAMIFDPDSKLGFIIFSTGSLSKDIDGYSDIHSPIIKTFYSIYPVHE